MCVYFRAMQSDLMDVETIRQERGSRQAEIDQERIRRETLDEDADDLDADQDSMKKTFNLSVSLQKDGMHLVYECASIDHHVLLV